jgi:hypothetical protein
MKGNAWEQKRRAGAWFKRAIYRHDFRSNAASVLGLAYVAEGKLHSCLQTTVSGKNVNWVQFLPVPMVWIVLNPQPTKCAPYLRLAPKWLRVAIAPPTVVSRSWQEVCQSRTSLSFIQKSHGCLSASF